MKKPGEYLLTLHHHIRCPARDPNAMEVDTIKVAKLTKVEREHYMKEGLCLRC